MFQIHLKNLSLLRFKNNVAMGKRILTVVTLAAALTAVVVVVTVMRRQPAPTLVPVTLAPEPRIEFGEIMVDSFCMEQGVIGSGQTLGGLLMSYGIEAKAHAALAQMNVNGFTVKNIRAGNRYITYTQPDSTRRLAYFIYQHSPIGYYVFDVRDSLRVFPYNCEVKAVRRVAQAEIGSSLWQTISDAGLPLVLALDMSDVFAWTVDFFGIQKGDAFRVLYDELYADTTCIGIGSIYAAWFVHRGERFMAFRFEQDSVPSYWDEHGQSLRKSFLKAPLRFSRISSRYTNSRLHPILKVHRPHTGVDYAAPAGTPVVAIGDGVVVEKGYNKAAGNYVKIRHNSVYTTGYNHFSRFGAGIAKGKRVRQGEVIGYVGATGYATGPHLDFRFWMNGKPIDPLRVESPPVEPIHPSRMEQFLHFRDSVAALLDSTLHFNRIASPDTLVADSSAVPQ